MTCKDCSCSCLILFLLFLFYSSISVTLLILMLYFNFSECYLASLLSSNLLTLILYLIISEFSKAFSRLFILMLCFAVFYLGYITSTFLLIRTSTIYLSTFFFGSSTIMGIGKSQSSFYSSNITLNRSF